MLADGCVLCHVFLGDGRGFGPGSVAACLGGERAEPPVHAGQRPVQIDRGRPGRAELADGFSQAPVGGFEVERNGQPVGRCGADQRGAAHLHGADGVRRLVQCGDTNPMQCMRQAGLVDNVDDAPLGMGAQGASGNAVDVHGANFGIAAGFRAACSSADEPTGRPAVNPCARRRLLAASVGFSLNDISVKTLGE